MTLKHGASDPSQSLLAHSMSCDCNSHTVRLLQALSFNSVCFSPNWPAISCCLHGKPSITPAKRPSLSICPQQSPRHISSAIVPPSLSSSTVLDCSICKVPMKPHYFLDQAHFAVTFGLDHPSGNGKVLRRATGSETKCYAPVKQCGTA